jgi:hypothetical protein
VRIRLVHTYDPYTRLTAGDEGEVVGSFTDAFGDRVLNVKWDSGSNLSLIEGIDTYQLLDEVLNGNS